MLYMDPRANAYQVKVEDDPNGCRVAVEFQAVTLQPTEVPPTLVGLLRWALKDDRESTKKLIDATVAQWCAENAD